MEETTMKCEACGGDVQNNVCTACGQAVNSNEEAGSNIESSGDVAADMPAEESTEDAS